MSTAKGLKIVPPPDNKSDLSERRSFVKRWKHEDLFNKGFVAVPTQFLRHYARLKPYPLNSGQALFVLHLMQFKWDSRAPYPGYKLLAKQMGISDKMARRHARDLETMKYLRRQIRVGRTNRFDLEPLFDALANAVAEEAQKKTKRPA